MKKVLVIGEDKKFLRRLKWIAAAEGISPRRFRRTTAFPDDCPAGGCLLILDEDYLGNQIVGAIGILRQFGYDIIFVAVPEKTAESLARYIRTEGPPLAQHVLNKDQPETPVGDKRLFRPIRERLR